MVKVHVIATEIQIVGIVKLALTNEGAIIEPAGNEQTPHRLLSQAVTQRSASPQEPVLLFAVVPEIPTRLSPVEVAVLEREMLIVSRAYAVGGS